MSKKYIGGTPARLPNQDAKHEAYLAERKLRDVSPIRDPRTHDQKQKDAEFKAIPRKPDRQHDHDSRIAALEKQVKADRREEQFRALKTEAERALFHLKCEREDAFAVEDAEFERTNYLKSIAGDLAKFDEVERRMLANKSEFDMRDFELIRKGQIQLRGGPDADKDIAKQFLNQAEAKVKSVLEAKRQNLLGHRSALDAEINKLGNGLLIDAEPELESESDFDRQLREYKEKKMLIDDAVARNDIAEAYRLLGVEPPTIETEEQPANE